jgi:(p)ppGpp synthase/HD superfamily hydrolase
MFVRAASFAAMKHKEQRRKNASADPYINHPLAVANVLVECGILYTYEEVLIGAVLHDTVEDTNTTLDELEKLFGPYIAHLVAEVTDDKSLSKTERKRLQITHAKHASVSAKLIKLADKYDNLRGLLADAPKGWAPSRIQGYFLWAREVVNNCRVHKEIHQNQSNNFKALQPLFRV